MNGTEAFALVLCSRFLIPSLSRIAMPSGAFVARDDVCKDSLSAMHLNCVL